MGLVLYSFITLLVMVNPIESAAAFETLTAGQSRQRQAAIALRSTIVAALILIIFGFVGEALLRTLGIGFPAFRIAGGLLLFKVGSNMVFAQQTQTQEASKALSQQQPDPSVFPLAIPIITGPGALTAAVTLWTKAYDHPRPVMAVLFLIVVSIVVFAITYVTMRGSQNLTKILGETGVDAIGRIMGIIVAAIAVQLVVESLHDLVPSIMKAGTAG